MSPKGHRGRCSWSSCLHLTRNLINFSILNPMESRGAMRARSARNRQAGRARLRPSWCAGGFKDKPPSRFKHALQAGAPFDTRRQLGRSLALPCAFRHPGSKSSLRFPPQWQAEAPPSSAWRIRRVLLGWGGCGGFRRLPFHDYRVLFNLVFHTGKFAQVIEGLGERDVGEVKRNLL